VDVLKRDVFHDRAADAIESDAGVALARPVAAGDGGLGQLRRVGRDRALDVAERDVAYDRRLFCCG
jgi:hypothetical protein